MDGEERRKVIIEILNSIVEPVSGTALANRLGVSRQVIVQDIALLRATNKNILSTNKGYIIYGGKEDSNTYKKVIAVRHDDIEMEDELYTIVDGGAKVLEVIIEHEVYGQITADLLIRSRRDVDEFMDKIRSNVAKPLKELTHDVHYHTIEADSKEIIDRVEEELRRKHYLI